MGSASSLDEREILKAYGAGIEQWALQQGGDDLARQRLSLLGRWNTSRLDQHVVDYDYADTYQDCDVAVIFGSWKPREKNHHVVRNSVAVNAKTFVCIETPLLNRKTKESNQYWRTGINGFLARSAEWPTADSHVCQQRLDSLGISWSGWRNNTNGHVLIALQLPGDASLRGIDINEWAYRSIKTVRENTDRLIIVRSHPLASQRAFGDHAQLANRILLENIGNITFSDGADRSWNQDLTGAYCTVTYSSGLAVDSVLAGIPTVACDPGNFAWGFSTTKLKKINQLEMPDSAVIQDWLRNLAICQFSVEEMSNGLAWQHTLPVIQARCE